ncbi:MAG: hypothetical protein BGN88_03190 [Clostridiales bacterium 43-6]|nr:MAG: hypothetical protein BGN88_03190 [Clostridiales bacterium 43-6]
MKRVISVCLTLVLALGVFSYSAINENKKAAASQTIKILSIGNSFSQNAQEYARAIMNAAGYNVKTANLYIGGCTLQTHWNNASSDAKAYTYQLKDLDNATYKEYQSYSIKQALESDDWDYVTFQQASPNSGQYNTFQPYLNNLSAYVRSLEPNAEQIVHQTWAYEINSTQSGFANYNRDQLTMFNKLKDANNQGAAAIGTRIIPSGEAFQIARATTEFDYSAGKPSLCDTDTYHASGYGKFLLGNVWAEVFTGQSVLNNTYKPSSVSDTQAVVLRQAAHDAVTLYAGTPTTTTTTAITPFTEKTFQCEDLFFLANQPTGTNIDTTNGNTVFLSATTNGDYIQFAIPGLSAGTYRVTVKSRNYSTRGIYKLFVNEQSIGGDIDMYTTALAYVESNFGTFTTTADGTALLKFSLVGKNQLSTGTGVYLDYIKLTNLTDPSSSTSSTTSTISSTSSTTSTTSSITSTETSSMTTSYPFDYFEIKYPQSEGYIIGLSQKGTDYNELIGNVFIPRGGIIKVYNTKNAEVTSGLIGTGFTLKVDVGYGFVSYPIIYYGDIDGTGTVNVIDLVYIKRHVLSLKKLEGVQFKAANLYPDEVINVLDIVVAKKHVLKIKSIKQS